MRAPAEATLLDAWDAAGAAGPTGRALALLAAAGIAPEEARGWSIGRRDAAILELRRAVFGDVLEGVADCPDCGARLEARLSAAELHTAATPPQSVTVERDGYRLLARCPDSDDVLLLERAPHGSDLPMLLLAQCLLTSEKDGQAVPASALPAPLRAALEQALEGADPLGDASLALDCPECGRAWTAALDVADWTWREVEGWAGRLLAEVHVLAGAYGWTEAEVLALSPRRRARYRELLGR
jgi:hypothetical protein